MIFSHQEVSSLTEKSEELLVSYQPSEDMPPVAVPPRASPSKLTRVSSFSLITQMVGASLLSVSYVYARLGLVAATVEMLCVSMTALALILKMIDVCYYVNGATFSAVVWRVLGPRWAICVEVCLILINYGFLVSYIIIASQSVESLFLVIGISGAGEGKTILLIKAGVAFGIMLPLSLLTRTSTLGYVASGSIVFILITVLSVVSYYIVSLFRGGQTCAFQPESYELGLRSPVPIWPKPFTIGPLSLSPGASAPLLFLSYFPMLMGNFSLHAGAPPTMYYLKSPLEMKRRIMRIAIVISFAFCFTMYSLMGYFGALLYGRDVAANILYSFKECGRDYYLTSIGVVYTLMVCIAYPLVQYPLKVSILNYCHIPEDRRCRWLLAYWGLSLGFTAAAFALGAAYDNIASIFGLFSCICGSVIYFVVPLLLWHDLPRSRAFSPQSHRLNRFLPPGEDERGEGAGAAFFALFAGVSRKRTTGKQETHLTNPSSSSSSVLPSGMVRKTDPKASLIKDLDSETSERGHIVTVPNIDEYRESHLRRMTPGRRHGFRTLIFIAMVVCFLSLFVNVTDLVQG
ncbi:Amino acid transporter family [Giardia muris]|uniref:Amino acid transporter family n=1 Tax=Giardia muris TaxID=5742 RepID=A0A4Z1STN2_GIAMU|nr:Amino acid transporter family [Giardia muris]|eukprot:TNJ26998.1 Amino acid transporter family [Giardia muris]